MKLCRFIISPLSPWAGWLRSDTLYGLICWYVAESEGETACRALIDAFCASRPPFELSSVMPAGYLPMPFLPPINRATFRELASNLGQKGEPEEIWLFNAVQKFKKFRKRAWLPLAVWQRHRHDLSTRVIFLDYEEVGADNDSRNTQKAAFEPHVSIDRSTGSARDGQLFFMRFHYFDPAAKFHLYVRAENLDYLYKYLKLIGELGFGRDASTGNGQFAIERDADFQPDSLDVADANASLLCSTCASSDMASLAGYYRLEVKRGKTGPGNVNPFKKPFLLLQEGSVLRVPPAGPFVLRNVNADSNIVQILQPLNFPCHLQLPEEN